MEKVINLIKNNYRLWLFYLAIATLFILELIVYINDRGDQTAFANELKHHGFFEYAIYRYQTWSSRLLIESVTMFMSGHYLIFDISFLVSTFLALYALSKIIFSEKQFLYGKYLLPIIFITVFPGVLFTSAGLIPTVTNYLFPLYALVIGWYLLNQKSYFSVLVAILAFAFAFMQEQFTVFGFLLIGFILIVEFVRDKKLNLRYLGAFVLTLIGLLSAAFSPGSAIRSTKEIATWYPGFDKLPLMTKILKGYLETNRILFVSAEINALFALLLVLIILTVIKRQWLSTFAGGIILYTLIINKLEMSSLLTAIQKTVDLQNTKDTLYFSIKDNLYPLILYTALLVTIALITFFLFKEKLAGLSAVVILLAGYATRMLVSMSPTIYASQLRTYIPLIFAIFLVILLLVREISPWIQAKYPLKQSQK
ncbi:hypothetical protein ACVR0S_06060 [Streptococcus dentapri]|uniref:Serotype determinant, transmembrane protein n=1 Tax=Streptococcus dentapri TaxID=573564 RepID=A0ABV8D3E7_9STRE